MQKASVAVLVLLVCSMFSVIYHVNEWEAKQAMLLDQLDYLVKHDYEKRSVKLKEEVASEIVVTVKSDVLSKMQKELELSYLPNQRQDNSLKLDFKYAIRDDIQKDITNTVRSSLKSDIKEVANEIIKNPPKVESYHQNLCSGDMNLPPHQKVLAYTVFGTRKLYYEGIPIMLRQAIASSLYYDWHIRIYHDALITPEIIASYKQYKNLHFCDARKLPKYGDLTNILGKFWRNVPIADETVDILCSRDLDSSLLTREEDAVREFLKSDKLLHTMRDFPEHQVGMLAGMWCLRPTINRAMAKRLLEDLLERAKTYKRRTDQPLLNAVIWDSIKDKQKLTLQHDAFHCDFYKGSKPFPTQRRDNMEFVGCPGHDCSWKNMQKCPKKCRPKNHQDWEYC